MVLGKKVSLPLQIVIAVALGVALGVAFPDGQLKNVGDFGKVIIHWVKLIAGPFLFLTIIMSLLEVRITVGQGVRVVFIALLNTSIALGLGMGLARVFLTDLQPSTLTSAAGKMPDVALDLANWSKTFMPPSLFHPFVQNDILLIGALALILALALRRGFSADRLPGLLHGAEQMRVVPLVLLEWLTKLIPVAVLSVVAASVSEHGYDAFRSVFLYVSVVLLGFVLQVVFVYGFWVLVVARQSPRALWRHARGVVAYAFGVNSSLASLPLTLRALKSLGVSDQAAALGAGVATNLNNDGIVLYEAMAVYFIAQLNHVTLSVPQMISAALACLVAAMGITGIPDAGFISLTVVVSTLGLPAEALPLLLAVDWLVARGRSVVNVLSDMTLAIALDALEPRRE